MFHSLITAKGFETTKKRVGSAWFLYSSFCASIKINLAYEQIAISETQQSLLVALFSLCRATGAKFTSFYSLAWRCSVSGVNQLATSWLVQWSAFVESFEFHSTLGYCYMV